ncbi:MAG TPA: hypothetical protein VH815_01115, partial [Acidobacteriota bacterium]
MAQSSVIRSIISALVILIFISAANAQDDCICSSQVHGPESVIAGLPDDDLGAKIVSNSGDGSYFLGWSSSRDLSQTEEVKTVQGQILNQFMVPISDIILFENSPSNVPGDPVFFGGVAFNLRKHQYFVVTGNNAFSPTGAKYGALKAYIVSDKGSVIASNIPVGDNRNFPATIFSSIETEVLFNSISREYVVKYTILFRDNTSRTVIQSFDEQGIKKRKAVFFRRGELRFDFQANQYLFVGSGIVNGIFEIKGQLLSAQLKRIGPLNIVLSVPYVGNDPYQYTGPFSIFNPVRKRFVIFWYEGPWNNSKIFERSLASDGTLERKVATGINRRIWEIRFNPVTSGYILIPNYSEVLRIDDKYRVTSGFSVTCQKPPAGNPFVVFNRFMQEYLLVWF